MIYSVYRGRLQVSSASPTDAQLNGELARVARAWAAALIDCIHIHSTDCATWNGIIQLACSLTGTSLSGSDKVPCNLPIRYHSESIFVSPGAHGRVLSGDRCIGDMPQNE